MKAKKYVSFAAAAALAVIFQMTACMDTTEKNLDAADKNGENILAYKSSSAEITEEIKGDIQGFEYYNGKIYFLSENIPDAEESSSEYYLNIADTDGESFSSRLISSLGRHILTVPEFDEDGTGYYIDVNADKSDITTYSLNKTDINGNITDTEDITDTVTENVGNEKIFYPDEIAVIGGKIYIASYDRLLVLTAEGEPVCDIREDIDGIQELVSSNDGTVYAVIFNMNGAYDLRKIDIEGGRLERGTELPFSGYSTDIRVIKGNESSNLFLSDGTFLSEYNTDSAYEEQKEDNAPILQWLSAGVSMMEVTNIFSDGDIFITAGKSYPHGLPKISVLTKQLVNNGDKKEIVLAGTEYAVNSYLENNVIRFNNENDDYYVTVKKYTGEDVIKQINLDITSGKMPDILFTDPYTPVDNLISKGLFVDMYELIDSDPELSREDFLPNLLAAFETGGKLYRFTDSFQVYTALGKESVFGRDNGITIDRLSRIAAERPDSETFPGVTKSDILTYALELSGGDFLDYENHTCNFTSEQFIKILEYANSYPDNVDGYFDDGFWNRFDTMFANEDALLMTAYLTEYGDVYRYEHAEFGEEVTAVGFPCEQGTGTSFIINSGFSVSQSSDSVDGAWQFVRTLLLPDYQDGITEFPVRNDSLEKAANTAMKHDPDRDNTAYVVMGQMMLASGAGDLGEPSREDIDKMNSIIALADILMSFDMSISDIINEEAAAYFAGSKSAQETAELIQQRVSLYLTERN